MTRFHKTDRDGFSRRRFLGGTLGTAALTAGSTRSEVAAGSEIHRGEHPADGGPHFDAPSNALVTGIDPDEIVLFAFDDHSIPLRQNLTMRLERPTLHENNPVLRLGKAGEPDSYFAAMYGTVFRLDGKFRMWYGAVDSWEEFEPLRQNMRLAYAESDDGIEWHKPKLGLREYHGSKANNLCQLDRECYNSPSILYEPDEPDPNRRYKMNYVGYHHKSLPGVRSPYLCVAYSADGLRWTDHPQNPVVRSMWSETSGIYRWNGVYYVNGQTSWPDYNPKRTMATFASADFEDWQQEAIISFYRHDLDARNHFKAGPQVHLGAGIWHRRNVLVGLYGQWEGPENDHYPDVRMNLGLIVSNDGILFREPHPDFAVIPYGQERGDWKTLRLLQGNAFVNHGEQTYIWYGAGSGDGIPIENRAMVGLATFPRDRFGYLQPHKDHAAWTSILLPRLPKGFRVTVNADGLSEQAWLNLELLDEQFCPVDRFSGDSAARISTSGLQTEVRWSVGTEVLPAVGRWRLRIRWNGPESRQIRFYAVYLS